MELCEYVFSIGFPLYVPKNGFFEGFEGEGVNFYIYYIIEAAILYYSGVVKWDAFRHPITFQCIWLNLHNF